MAQNIVLDLSSQMPSLLEPWICQWGFVYKSAGSWQISDVYAAPACRLQPFFKPYKFGEIFLRLLSLVKLFNFLADFMNMVDSPY